MPGLYDINYAMISRQTPYEDLPEYLTPQEFARKMGLGKSTVYQLLDSGELPCRRFGRRIFIHRDLLRSDRMEAS